MRWHGPRRVVNERKRREKAGADSAQDTAKYATILEQAMEGIRARAAWVERDTDDVSAWLAQHKA